MPATPTYAALSEITIAATTASVTLPVPAGFRDLILVIAGTSSADAGQGLIQFNGDTGSNYSGVGMYSLGSGSGSSYTYSGTGSIGMFLRTVQGNSIVQIMDYSATNKHKTFLIKTNSADYVTYAEAARWASTSAISSIYLSIPGANFNAGTTINLYGIEA